MHHRSIKHNATTEPPVGLSSHGDKRGKSPTTTTATPTAGIIVIPTKTTTTTTMVPRFIISAVYLRYL
jgi:hypothetical protein